MDLNPRSASLSSSRRTVGLSIALLAAVGPFLPGCEIAYVVARRRAARGEGGPYRQAIQEKIHHDEKEFPIAEYGADAQLVGLLPADLQGESDDPEVRYIARGGQGQTSLTFAGIHGELICFQHRVIEEVINYSEDEVERVRRIARSYKFSVEFAGPLTSPEVTNHPDEPGPNAVDVNEAKVVSEEPERSSKTLKDYLVETQLRCAPTPRKPKDARFLTAIVTPSKSVELSDDRYLLVWRIKPEARAGR